MEHRIHARIRLKTGHIVRIIFTHHTCAAEREQLKAEKRAADFFPDQSRSQTQREFIHADFIYFSQSKMSQFMEYDNQAE